MLESASVPLEKTFDTACSVTTGRSLDAEAGGGAEVEVSMIAKRSFVPK
jgi:hypothetical protein